LSSAKGARFRLLIGSPFQVNCVAYSLNNLHYEQRNLRELWMITIANSHSRNVPLGYPRLPTHDLSGCDATDRLSNIHEYEERRTIMRMRMIAAARVDATPARPLRRSPIDSPCENRDVLGASLVPTATIMLLSSASVEDKGNTHSLPALFALFIYNNTGACLITWSVPRTFRTPFLIIRPPVSWYTASSLG
jgi:hypothetical protein